MKTEGGFQEAYTIDGKLFYDTRAAMNDALEEERIKADGLGGKDGVEDEVRSRLIMFKRQVF